MSFQLAVAFLTQIFHRGNRHTDSADQQQTVTQTATSGHQRSRHPPVSISRSPPSGANQQQTVTQAARSGHQRDRHPPVSVSRSPPSGANQQQTVTQTVKSGHQRSRHPPVSVSRSPPLQQQPTAQPDAEDSDSTHSNETYVSFMDQQTQPDTQPVEYLQAKGASSKLTVEDEADILCFLHPASSSAIKAAELVSESTPQHVHINHDNEDIFESAYGTKSNEESQDSDSDHSPPDIPRTRVTPPDIALRMTSTVRDPLMGFVFGRNSKKCDLLIAKDTMRLSSAHFRIYMNHNFVLMLEDLSTNGTMVDGNLLRGLKSDPHNLGQPATHSLQNGSMIKLPSVSSRNEEWMRFIVLIPQRNHGLDAYEANLAAYVECLKQFQRRAEVAKRANCPVPPTQPMPFTPLQRNDSPRGSSIAAATGQNHYGMRWNGGEKYNIVGHIGAGAFATVYKISTVQQGEVYACKQIEKRRYVKDGQPGEKMHNEIKIMERLSHPNIVQFVDSHETDHHIFIIMEYVPMGDLTMYTNGHKVMHERMGQHVALQICDALKYLHGLNTVHRDIKPDNILFANHNPYVFKLSDFGLSRIVTKQDEMRTFCGTILYCAPEIYPRYEWMIAGLPSGKKGRHVQYPREGTRPYDCSVDTWGIAAVLFHLLSGHPPWTGTNEDNGAVMLEKVLLNPPDWTSLSMAGVSEIGVTFLVEMLQIDPANRATDEEVLAHQWIRQVRPIKSAKDNQDHDDNGSDQQGGSENDSDKGDEELPDASQLRINDQSTLHGFDTTDATEHGDALDEDQHPPKSNRVGPWNGSQQPWKPGSTIPLDNMARHNPLHLPTQNSFQDAQVPLQANNRLFGEIPESALQNSGFLGQNAQKALDLDSAQMEDPEDHNVTDGFDDESMDGLEGEDELYEDGEQGYHEEGEEEHDDDDNEEEEEEEEEEKEEKGETEEDYNDPHQDYTTEEREMWPNAYRSAAAYANASIEKGSGPVKLSVDSDPDINTNHYTNHHTSHHTNRAALQNPSTLPQALNDPSLHGAEDLVEDLNMVSPQSGLSEASEHVSNTARPDRAANRDKSPAHPHSKRSSQHLQSEPQTASFKRPKTGHPTPRSKQPSRSSRRLKDKKLKGVDEQSNRGSNDQDVGPSSSKEIEEEEVSSSFEMKEVATEVSRPYRIRDDPTELFIAAEVHQEWKKAHPEQADYSKDALVEFCSKPRPTGPPPIDANTGPNLNTHVDPLVNLLPFQLDTPVTLGVLVPVEGSIPTVPAIKLTNRVTTFGRDPDRNTFVHPGDVNTPNWERVGRNCIDLTFWYRNIEKEIDDKTLPPNWYQNPSLSCLLSTRTSRYILVNGVKLTKGKLCWQYGKLHTGDIITAVDPDLDRAPNHDYETQSLSFRCEFYIGASKDPRPADGSDPFTVEVEEDEYFKSNERICNGWGRGMAIRNRERKLAQGIDPDAEMAERRAAYRERTRPAREKAEREDAEFEVLLVKKREELGAKKNRTEYEDASYRALVNYQKRKAKEQEEILAKAKVAAAEKEKEILQRKPVQRGALDNPDEKPPPNPADSNNLRF